ncbi:hypothetical protein ACP4OV_003235 [Aristida adscensionis]
MRRLSSAARGGAGEKVGVLAFEVAALMSRAASLWRALGGTHLARLRGEAIRLEGVRRLVADDDAALLALAVAEMAGACVDLSRAVARLSARCADPLLRRFDALFAALVKGGAGGDPHGLRYAAERKMDRKARKMQRLVAATAHLCHELDVLSELEQAVGHGGRRGGRRAPVAGGECARRVATQRQEVERLRAASLWNRSFDYAVRLLARSLFTIVARITEVFDLAPIGAPVSAEDDSKLSRLSWSSSFVSGSMQSMVYPSDDVSMDAAPALPRTKSGKIAGADAARRFLMSRSKSLRQLMWPAAGKHLIGCVVTGSKSPVRDRWVHGDGDGEPPLSFNYMLPINDEYYYTSGISFQFQVDRSPAKPPTPAASVFEPSSCTALAAAPPGSLGAAALALHYAHLIILVERLAASPHEITPDDRDALYGMLTGRIRASLRARLRPLARNAPPPSGDPAIAGEWRDTVRGILRWLAPLAHNMLRWKAERSFEQRNVASDATVLLLQTLHYADQRKTEAAVTELLVGLNYMWRSGREEPHDA